MKIYLDNNLIAYARGGKHKKLNEIIEEKKQAGHVFVFSPAHLEEIAVSEKRTCVSVDTINTDLDFITELCGNHSIRPIDKDSVLFDTEYPRECYQRVLELYHYNDLAEELEQAIMDNFHDNPAGDPKETNNQDPVQLFSHIINKELLLKCLMTNKSITQLEAISCLKNDDYEVVINRFFALQLSVGYLANWLEEIGYFRESRKKARSRMHDVSHIIYAAYSDLLVSNDTKLVKKALVIYSILGIKTNVVPMEKFIEQKS
jgi:hypothetical protein